MRKNTIGMWLVPAALVAALSCVVVACGTSDSGASSGGAVCVPGAQTSCACPGGAQGVQVCNADGRSLGACECAGSGSGSGSSSSGAPSTCGNAIADMGEECDDGNMSNTDSCTNACKKAVCGDGFVQPGEDCDDGNSAEFDTCPNDCKLDGGGASDASDAGKCDGVLTYAGMTDMTVSVWSYMGKLGTEAGDAMCQQIGADHHCDYEEVKTALAKGELGADANLQNGVTAWVDRTTTEKIDGQGKPDANGMSSAPGAGARCNNFTYGTNHISDGEYVEFSRSGNTVSGAFTLDSDSVFDGNNPGVHTNNSDMPCGGVSRRILCCFPKCMP
jgi:cysteine-rich repeat protein